MAINKEKKGEIFGELQKIVKDAASMVFINFHGLPVSESSQVRRGLREKNVNYLVAKKSLSRKALSEAGIEGVLPDMPGEFGLIYGEDLLAPAREVFEFQKKFDKKLQIVGGVFEGRFLNQSEMITVAQIPGIKTLQAQFVNLLNSPIQRFVVALNEIAKLKA